MEYGTAKRSLKEIWGDVRKRPVITSGLVIFCLLAVYGGIALATIVAKEAGKIEVSQLLSGKESKKVLNYESIKMNQRGEDELYRSYFLLRIHSPAGDNDDTFTFKPNLSPESVCSYAETGFRDAEVRIGLASTTDYYVAACTTREAIIDNGSIFTLVK